MKFTNYSRTNVIVSFTKIFFLKIKKLLVAKSPHSLLRDIEINSMVFKAVTTVPQTSNASMESTLSSSYFLRASVR